MLERPEIEIDSTDIIRWKIKTSDINVKERRCSQIIADVQMSKGGLRALPFRSIKRK